jgi:hypothetical protein
MLESLERPEKKVNAGNPSRRSLHGSGQNETPIPAEYNCCRSGPGTSRGPGVIVMSPGPRMPARWPREGPHQFGCGERVSRKSERRKKCGVTWYLNPPPYWILNNTFPLRESAGKLALQVYNIVYYGARD